jgi:hypothetical protein
MLKFLCAGMLIVSALVAEASLFAAAAQPQRDDRFFMLRDPFRQRRNILVPRDFRPPGTLRAEPRVEPRIEPTRGVVYGSSADADAARTAPATEYVVVMGDTLADQLAQGLADAFAEERPEVAVIKKTRDSTGFVRDDVFNWVAEGPRLLEGEKATAVVVMLGMNDRQVLRDETGAHQPRSDRWRELYNKRIEDFLTKLKEKNAPVFMVGLPAMQLARLSADMPYFNEIFRERAQKAGTAYIDIWEGFVDERGDFALFGPALDGQRRRLRMNDGVHFSKVGARKLAHFVERDLIRLFASRSGPTVTPQETVPDPGPGPRPIAGPVISLSIPSAQISVLAGSSPRTVPMDSTASRTLVEGLPAHPVVGRADDFRWQQPAIATEASPATPEQRAAAPASIAR